MADTDAHGGPDGRGFTPSTYGSSFADVYDRWYPADQQTTDAVDRIASTAGPGGRVLELGVGTGRLALPLAERGLRVTGLDASPEMIDLLRSKTSAATELAAVLGDVGTPGDWPEGPFDVVVGAFNLVLNLAGAAAQASCFAAAARCLTPGGAFIVETFLPAPLEHRERRLVVREVTVEGVVLIATDSDPSDGVVTGQHIELRDGEPVRLRPWRIRVADTDELDRFAHDAGLELVERHADWTGTAFDAHGAGQVSCYRR